LMRRVASSDPLLTELDLRGFQLGPDGAADLASAMQSNKTVTTLILWVNHIGDQGAVALAPVLATHPRLELIDLFDNDISDEGAIALASVIAKSKSMRTLNVWTNLIGDEGAFAIATALQRNAGLTSMMLDKNKISDDGASALANAVAQNKVLTTFSIKDNPNILDNNIILELTRGIARNQAAKRALEESEAKATLDRDMSFPIHSGSQTSDLALLSDCVGNAHYMLGLCEDSETGDRVDLTPALTGDRSDNFGQVLHGDLPMLTGWEGNRKG